MAPSVNSIDPTGNTILHTRSLSLRVSSKTLSLASPGFASLFANAPTSVSLYEDDPSALTIIANIFHFKTSEKDVPRGDIYAPLLYNVALVCKKYQCIQSLGPWVDIWLSSFKKARDENDGRHWKEWLAIGQIFDKPEIAAWASEKAIIMGSVEDLEACADSVGDHTTISELLITRSKHISAVLGCTSRFLQYVIAQDHHSCDAHSARCGAMVLGSIVKGLVKCGPYPPPSKPYPGMSLDRILDALEGMELFVEEGHARCAQAVEAMKTNLLEEVRGCLIGVDMQSPHRASSRDTLEKPLPKVMTPTDVAKAQENSGWFTGPTQYAGTPSSGEVPEIPPVAVPTVGDTSTTQETTETGEYPDSISINKRYCVCDRTPSGKMIECKNEDKCAIRWFHTECIGLAKETADSQENWACPLCVKSISPLKEPTENTPPPTIPKITRPKGIPAGNNETVRILARLHNAGEIEVDRPSSPTKNEPSTKNPPGTETKVTANAEAKGPAPEVQTDAQPSNKPEPMAHAAEEAPKAKPELEESPTTVEQECSQAQSSSNIPERANVDNFAALPTNEPSLKVSVPQDAKVDDSITRSDVPSTEATAEPSGAPAKTTEMPTTNTNIQPASPTSHTDAGISTPVQPATAAQNELDDISTKSDQLKKAYPRIPKDVICSILERFKGSMEPAEKECTAMVERKDYYSTKKHKEAAPLSTPQTGLVTEKGTFTVGEISKYNPQVKRLKADFPNLGHDAFLKFIKDADGDYDVASAAIRQEMGIRGQPTGMGLFSATTKLTPITPITPIAPTAAAEAETTTIPSATERLPSPVKETPILKATKKRAPSVEASPAALTTRAPLTPIKKTNILPSDDLVNWDEMQQREIMEGLARPNEGNMEKLSRLKKRFKGIETKKILDVFYRSGWKYEETKAFFKKIEKKEKKAAATAAAPED